MKIMDAIKNDIVKLKDIKPTPKQVKTAVGIGGGIMFLLNLLDSSNDRKTMKAELMDEMGDEMVAKVIEKLSNINGES